MFDISVWKMTEMINYENTVVGSWFSLDRLKELD